MGDAVVGHAVVRHAVVRHALYTPPAVEVRVNPHQLLEDNVVAGGAGSAVNEYLIKLNSKSSILNLGLPDQFIEHGDQEQQKILNGLDGNGVEKSIQEKLKLI